MYPRITFGMIVLNGEPFVRYNLRALYPFAHQIIVVEGACPSARSVTTQEGHSSDGTLEALWRFKAGEDREGKLLIVTAEDEGYPNGFWPEKDEMSQAYAKRATGNYVWQIDCDEFYQPQDMQTVIEMLQNDPEIKAVTFRVLTFWGGLGYRTDGIYLQRGAHDFHRLFAWGPGYRYVTHRPPTVVDGQGRDLRRIKAVTGAEMARKGIYLYHYELLFPKQVLEKCKYYSNAAWTNALRDAERWARECYMELKHPFRVHMVYEYPSWLERYHGEHPPQVVEMVKAVKSGRYPNVKMRSTDDVEALLSRPFYRAIRALLKARLPVERSILKARASLLNIVRHLPVWPLFRRMRQELRGKLPRSVSTGYASIAKEKVTPELAYAWQEPSIAYLQRQLVDRQLAQMYKGNVIAEYRVMAEAVRSTGYEAGEIVEVGCASGYYYEVLGYLLGRKISYFGIDYSKPLIDDARRHYGEIFVVGDATALPLGNEICDVLISGTVLLHVLEYEKAIAESARVTRAWAIFHRTPVVSGSTKYYTKFAYGVKCVEIHFGEQELLSLFRRYGLDVIRELEVSHNLKTYVCYKIGRG
jgi:SAM-dependent methyltransferase